MLGIHTQDGVLVMQWTVIWDWEIVTAGICEIMTMGELE